MENMYIHLLLNLSCMFWPSGPSPSIPFNIQILLNMLIIVLQFEETLYVFIWDCLEEFLLPWNGTWVYFLPYWHSYV